MTRRIDREEFRAWLRPYVDAQAFPDNGSYVAQAEAIIARIMCDRKSVELPVGTTTVLSEMVGEKIGRKTAPPSLHNLVWRVRLNKQKEFATDAAE